MVVGVYLCFTPLNHPCFMVLAFHHPESVVAPVWSLYRTGLRSVWYCTVVQRESV